MDKSMAALLLGWLVLFTAYPGYAQVGRDGRMSPGADRASPEHQRSFFLDGVYGGIGATAYGYRGALRQNPNNNVLKYVTAAQPSVHLGVDRRMGRYEQYGLDLYIGYNRVAGQVSGADGAPFTFQSHLVSIEATGMYSLPYIRQDLLRVFAGGGMLLTLAPSFSANPPSGYSVDANGGRMAGTLVGGLLIRDVFRIGIRLPTSSTLAFASLDQTIRPTPDILGFVELTYRFEL
jgi:hypothetical protein